MIAVDIGNTNIGFFWFDKGKLRKKVFLPTASLNRRKLIKSLKKFPLQPIFLCSVVPSATRHFTNLARPVYLAGRDFKIPIKCQYNKKQIGQDRLVAAFAARNLFPKAQMVVDFGTAITIDVLSATGVYRGGIILPGIGSTLKVFSSCALLPKQIKLIKTKGTIPRNTAASINQGLTEGFSAMLNTLVIKYRRALKLRGGVVLTGGEAVWLKAKLNFRYDYEPLLVAKGLAILSQKLSACL